MFPMKGISDDKKLRITGHSYKILRTQLQDPGRWHEWVSQVEWLGNDGDCSKLQNKYHLWGRQHLFTPKCGFKFLNFWFFKNQISGFFLMWKTPTFKNMVLSTWNIFVSDKARVLPVSTVWPNLSWFSWLTTANPGSQEKPPKVPLKVLF